MLSSLTDKQYNELIQARLKSPESFRKALVNRKRRKLIGKDGRLLIVAADHTARGIISAGSEKYIIANRRLLLDRLVRSLSNPNVDGVLASADIVEELAWLGALESKLVFGTMNRGGYLGTTWGLDDPVTAYDADSIAELGLDAGKVLVRFEDTDIGVGRTIEYVVEAMRLLAERKIVCLVEPLPYKKMQTACRCSTNQLTGSTKLFQSPQVLVHRQVTPGSNCRHGQTTQRCASQRHFQFFCSVVTQAKISTQHLKSGAVRCKYQM